MRVPFARGVALGCEREYVLEAVAGGELGTGGPFAERCERWLAERTGAGFVALTHSCSGALEVAALLADVGPGDEVILPSFTFPSTANAFVLRGAVPVFVDIRPDTLNLDESLVEAALTPRTRALVPVHYSGVAVEMEPLLSLARAHDLFVIEDAAQALGASYRGRPLGSLGQLAAVSFQQTKNLYCGEGGALFVNDPRLVARAEVLLDKGTDRGRFRRGEVEHYSWNDVGSAYRPGELTAAFLYGQLVAADTALEARGRAHERYRRGLVDTVARFGARLQRIPEPCAANHHAFPLLLSHAGARPRFIEAMRKRGVSTPFHYTPLHQSAFGRKKGRTAGALRVTEELAARLVRLPLFNSIREAEVDYVIESVLSALPE